jgi:trk system potassium uptake protein
VKKSHTFQTVFNILGPLLYIQGFLLLLPLIPVFIYHEYAQVTSFVIPSLLCLVSGLLLQKYTVYGQIDMIQSMLVCGMAWIVLSLLGCLPFYMGTDFTYLDSFFEAVSGFTTTGITLYTNIEILPKSILFWRGFIQWLGGLGILTFFLAVMNRSTNKYFNLFSAETHKIHASLPVPSVSRTVLILWGIYTFFTLSEVATLRFLGVSLFDAFCHSFTTLSTGGFSTYDASIGHFYSAGYENWKIIEYAITFFMFLGGMSFLLHYKIITGNPGEVRRNTEFHYFVALTLGTTVFMMIDHYLHFSDFSLETLESTFRNTIFSVVSIITTTGYGTTDINDPFFPAMSKQIFIILMLIGGCVGSTGGGIKVQRIVILIKAFGMQLKRVGMPGKALSEVVVDSRIISDTELKRVIGLFFGWLILLAGGGIITALFTDLGSWEALSGMFSAVGNIGPCYISVQQMSELPAVVKLTYILGMLAGRLEILPVLLIFSPRSWR